MIYKDMATYMRHYRQNNKQIVIKNKTKSNAKKYIQHFADSEDLKYLENMIENQQQKILVHANS